MSSHVSASEIGFAQFQKWIPFPRRKSSRPSKGRTPRYPQNPSVPTTDRSDRPSAIDVSTSEKSGSTDKSPKVRANMGSIMEAICSHEADSPKGKTPAEHLPNFDDVTQYGATEEQEKKLWTLEARRLLKVAECHEMPLEFDGEGILGESNEQGYQQLSDLGDQILCNFRVCLHDSQLLALEFCPDLCDVKEYRRLKRFLESRFDESPSDQWPKLLKVRN